MHLRTEGIKYAGSKLKLLPYILGLVQKLPGVESVLDGFSGSTRVSQAFAQLGYKTSANDISMWSEVLATCYLKPSKPDEYYQKMIDYLNSLAGYDGWFTDHYGGSEHDKKRLFQRKNTRKLDNIRTEIEKFNLPWEEKCVLLTSLILALDKVDNTLGHYAAYLSNWSIRSYNDLMLTLPKRFQLKDINSVYREDVFSVINNRKFDLVYYDPPYGSNNEKMPPSRVRYAAYYHFWTTLILDDKPELFGKANRREDTRDSVSKSIFEEYKKNQQGNFIALEALHNLIKQTNTDYLLLSYSSGGRATKEQLMEVIKESATLIEIKKIDYRKNIMSEMKTTGKWITTNDQHQEYLFLMKK